jgi:energy-coupling factor transporter transmembrane protein EcfT
MWRRLHAWAAIVWVAAIIVQVFLAGQAIANLGGSGDFTTHIGVGYTIGIVQLVTLIVAFPARMAGRDKWISAGILGLYIVQTLLPDLKSVLPLISALHPLNAMLLFAVSIWYARHAWRVASMPAGAAAVAAEAPAKAG